MGFGSLGDNERNGRKTASFLKMKWILAQINPRTQIQRHEENLLNLLLAQEKRKTVELLEIRRFISHVFHVMALIWPLTPYLPTIFLRALFVWKPWQCQPSGHHHVLWAVTLNLHARADLWVITSEWDICCPTRTKQRLNPNCVLLPSYLPSFLPCLTFIWPCKVRNSRIPGVGITRAVGL